LATGAGTLGQFVNGEKRPPHEFLENWGKKIGKRSTDQKKVTREPSNQAPTLLEDGLDPNILDREKVEKGEREGPRNKRA